MTIKTLGYHSRTEACAALAARGFGRQAIAEKLGITRQTVTQLLWHHKRRQMRVNIPLDVAKQLEQAAKLRGLTPSELVRNLVDVIARDQMVDAILDDSQETCAEGAQTDRRSATAAPAGTPTAREAQQ